MPEVQAPVAKLDLKIFNGGDKSTWCPGCGDFGILAAIKQALPGIGVAPHQVMLVSGIGCGSKLPHYMRANGFNSLHGRALPVAQGIKLANHALKVIAVTGDGDGYGIGMGHFMHLARRNVDITHIVENNQVYGLTKGQYSPTSERGYISSFSPEGALEYAVNPILLAVAGGATFVARGFAGDVKQLVWLIQQAVQHPGYALWTCSSRVSPTTSSTPTTGTATESTSCRKTRPMTRPAATSRWPARWSGAIASRPG